MTSILKKRDIVTEKYFILLVEDIKKESLG